MRRTDQYFRLWEGKEMEAALNGELTFQMGELDSEWNAGEQDRILFQLNNTLYLFELKQIPEGSKVLAGMLQDSGLHTGNHGGVRLRLEAPLSGGAQDFELDFTVIGRRF